MTSLGDRLKRLVSHLPTEHAPRRDVNVHVCGMDCDMDRFGFFYNLMVYDENGRCYHISDNTKIDTSYLLLSNIEGNAFIPTPRHRGEYTFDRCVKFKNSLDCTLISTGSLVGDHLSYDILIHNRPKHYNPSCPYCGRPLSLTHMTMRCTNGISCPGRRVGRMNYFLERHSDYFGTWLSDALNAGASFRNLSPVDLVDPVVVNDRLHDLSPDDRWPLITFRHEVVDCVLGRGDLRWCQFFALMLVLTLSIPGLDRHLIEKILYVQDRDSMGNFLITLANAIDRSYPGMDVGRPEIRFTPEETMGFPLYEEMSCFTNELRRLQRSCEYHPQDDM